MRHSKRIAVAAASVVLGLALVACTQQPEPQPGPPEPEPSVSSAPIVVDTEFTPGGSASDNKAHFDAIAGKVSAANRTPRGVLFVDALAAGGFDKAAMEVTFDKTAIDLFADNVQFSVLIGGECIIGQDGNVGYQSTVLPVLSSGSCLVGKTRPITW